MLALRKNYNSIREIERQKAITLTQEKQYKEAIDTLLNKKYFKKEGVELYLISIIYDCWAKDAEGSEMQAELISKSRKYLRLYHMDRLLNEACRKKEPQENTNVLKNQKKISSTAGKKSVTFFCEGMEDEGSECLLPVIECQSTLNKP